MDRYFDSRYLLARFLAMIPPEVPGAMVLLALQHPGLVAAIFAILFVLQIVVLKFIAVAIVSVSKFVVGAIAGSVATWYLQKMFMLHAWPRLPHGLQRYLLKLKDRILFAPADKDQAAKPPPATKGRPTRETARDALADNAPVHPTSPKELSKKLGGEG